MKQKKFTAFIAPMMEMGNWHMFIIKISSHLMLSLFLCDSLSLLPLLLSLELYPPLFVLPGQFFHLPLVGIVVKHILPHIVSLPSALDLSQLTSIELDFR